MPVTSAALAISYDPAEASERARLEALDRYDLLGSGPDPAFDCIVRLIRNIFDLPIGIVSVIDAHRQWYKASEGLTNDEVGINDTFCRRALDDPAGMFIEDATNDARFADSPFVTGGPQIRSYAGAPLTTRDGHSIGTICAIGTKPRQFSERERQILIDLAQLTMEEMELRHQATTDGLTGAMSRRAFNEAGRRLHTHAMRQGQQLATIVLDIDHFKKVNDTHGHPAGDHVLKTVAQLCRKHLRESDLFGRIGGEEFAIVLPETNQVNAAALGEKLRAAIQALDIRFKQTQIAVTSSFGVAGLNLSALDLETMISQADTALYQAKSRGRNKVIQWDPAELSSLDVRRRVLKAGRIVYGGGDFTAECSVRSLSERSAGMDVINSSNIPETFRLVIASDRISKNCKVMARAAKHLEVEFIDDK